MKLPQWITSGQIETRKETAQLRAAPAMRQVRNQRFIPEMTASQYASSESQQISTITSGVNSLAKVFVAISKAKDDGELRAAEAEYINASAAVETGITTQPHERIAKNPDGTDQINYVTGKPVIERPYETAQEDYHKYSQKLEQEIADKYITSDRVKKKFALSVAKGRRDANKRITKWQMGNHIDRANATYSVAIAQAKSHEQVERVAAEALQNYADPKTIIKAQQKAHQNITYTGINNHLAAVTTNMDRMGAQEVGNKMAEIYGLWQSEKHTLTPEMNSGILKGLVAADKYYNGTIRDDNQKRNLMDAIVDYSMATPQDRAELREQFLSGDLYETYGSSGAAFVKSIIEAERFGEDTPEGIREAEAIKQRAFYGEDRTGTSVNNIITLNNSKVIGTDTLADVLNFVRGTHKDMTTEENKLAVSIFKAATNSGESSFAYGKKASAAEKAMRSKLEAQLSTLKVRFMREVKAAQKAGQIDQIDRIGIAVDMVDDLEVPSWALNREGKPAESIREFDPVQTKKPYMGENRKNRPYDQEEFDLLQHQSKQVKEILRGLGK